MTWSSYFKRLNFFLKDHNYTLYFLIFIISFGLFSWLQASSTFADPDSFYHTKMALLIRKQGPVMDFPWTQASLYKDYWIDHHFLYHLILIPFVLPLEPLLGMKLAAITFASLAIFSFYWFLRISEIRGAFFYSLLLLVINPLIFRLGLAKAPALSLVFLFLGLLFIFKKKYWPLFFLSFFFVWLHSSWPIILVVVVLYSLVGFLDDWAKKRKIPNLKSRATNIKLILSSLAGLVAGIIVNPYFPKNLIYWRQIFKMALVSYHKMIGIGAEWYSYGFFEIIARANFVFIILTLALVLFFIKFQKQTPRTWTLLILTLLFFLYTLKARRQVEYFVPLAVAFSAFSLNKIFVLASWSKLWLDFKTFFAKNKVLVTTLLIYFFVTFSLITFRSIERTNFELKSGFSFTKLKKVSLWLKDNTPQDTIVFASDWDIFPFLFYYNTHNLYITGLDQTFMYEYDQDLYWQWVRITRGEVKSGLYDIIKNKFGASYILIERDKYEEMDAPFKDNDHFELIYEDEEGKVYQVIYLGLRNSNFAPFSRILAAA